MEQLQQAGVSNGGQRLQRRGLFGAILGALAAGLVSKARPAQAEDGASLILGEAAENLASTATRLELKSEFLNVPAFKAIANTGGANTGVATTNNGLMPLTLPTGNIGVFGCTDDGVGCWGQSDTNIGTWGVARTGVGVLGTTYPPEEPGTPEEYPPAGVFGRGNSQVGVWATSEDNVASWAISKKGIGVAGQSPHIGGWFMIGAGPPDDGFWRTLEPAALHTTAMGTDVSACCRADQGVAVMAEAKAPLGTAIMAMGRIQSDMVGRSMILRGQDMLFVPCITVDAQRGHVSVTPLGDVGSFWVELLTGRGFVVHLDKAAKADTDVTYLVVEMMDHEHTA